MIYMSIVVCADYYLLNRVGWVMWDRGNMGHGGVIWDKQAFRAKYVMDLQFEVIELFVYCQLLTMPKYCL